MRNTSVVLRLTITAVSLMWFAALSTSAQSQKDFAIGKKGEIHFNVPVRVGTIVLKPGMYQVQHAMEGADHVVGFREMEMPAGYRHSNTPVADEPSERIKCRVEPVSKKPGNSSIVLRTNASGEKELVELQIAGEAFKHIF